MRPASHSVWLGLGLAVLTVFSVGAGLALGSEALPLGAVYRALGQRLGLTGLAAVDATTVQIVWELRLPRVLLALLVGGGLAVIGVAMQALVRNPLAEPYILGLSSGASAGVSLFYLGFLPPLLSQALSTSLAAFLGALITIVIVYLVARTGQTLSIARLLLAGVAISALMGAVNTFLTLLSPDLNKLQAILFLLIGSLSGTTWALLPLPTIVTLGTAALLWGLARPLDAMLLGEEPARSLGVPVEALKRFLIVLAALATGVLVATSGAIGFVGLIVPHAVRTVVGVGHRRVVPVCFVVGALFLLWSDVLARTALSPLELPVGIVTALCGVPFFLVLLRRAPYRFG